MKTSHRVLLTSLLAVGVGLEAKAATEPSGQVEEEWRQAIIEIDRARESTLMIERLAAVKRLGALDQTVQPQRSRELLEVFLGDPDPTVAFQAEVELARRLGIDVMAAKRDERRLVEGRAALDECRAALESDDPLERLAALERLASMISDPDSTSPARVLLTTARGDADPAVGYQARFILARFDGVDLIAPDLREQHRLSEQRRQLDEWETALGSAAAIDRLMAVKGLAAFADEALEPYRAISLLRAALSDPDHRVAEQAGRVLELRADGPDGGVGTSPTR